MVKPSTVEQTVKVEDIRRADFTVQQQLVGKLGKRGYGQLLDRLNSITRKGK